MVTKKLSPPYAWLLTLTIWRSVYTSHTNLLKTGQKPVIPYDAIQIFTDANATTVLSSMKTALGSRLFVSVYCYGVD